MPSATVSLLRFCELTLGDIPTDWCSSRSTFGASRGRSQSKRRSQSSVATPEAIAFFFCQPKTLFPVDSELPVESEEPITPLYAGGYRNFFLVNPGGPSKSNRRSQSL